MSNQLEVARQYLIAGNAERALETLGGLDDATQMVQAWAIRAAAEIVLTDHEAALQAARNGLELDPNSSELLSLGAHAAAELGRLPEAERMVLQALDRDPDDPDHLCLYAEIVARAGQIEKAETLLARAESIDPECQAALLGRANVAYLRGDKRALTHYAEELLRVDPAGKAGQHMRGVAMANSGRMREAARHYAEAAGIDPADHSAAETARSARFAIHPLLWPMWPVMRFGPWVVWGAGVAALILSRSLAPGVAGIVVVVWIAYVIYTWVAPPILERVLARE